MSIAKCNPSHVLQRPLHRLLGVPYTSPSRPLRPLQISPALCAPNFDSHSPPTRRSHLSSTTCGERAWSPQHRYNYVRFMSPCIHCCNPFPSRAKKRSLRLGPRRDQARTNWSSPLQCWLDWHACLKREWNVFSLAKTCPTVELRLTNFASSGGAGEASSRKGRGRVVRSRRTPLLV